MIRQHTDVRQGEKGIVTFEKKEACKSCVDALFHLQRLLHSPAKKIEREETSATIAIVPSKFARSRQAPH